jgi:hypothetical protein
MKGNEAIHWALQSLHRPPSPKSLGFQFCETNKNKKMRKNPMMTKTLKRKGKGDDWIDGIIDEKIYINFWVFIFVNIETMNQIKFQN